MTELLSSRGESDSESKRRSPWWLYVAPAANLFAGHWLLHERQHEPLISGVSSGFERTRARRGRGEPRQNRSLAPVRRALELAPASAPRHVEEYVAVVDLTAYVAKDFELDLIGLTEPPVVATVASISWASGGKRRDARLESVFARVELGKLYVTLTVSASRRISRAPQLLEHAEVAWIVRVLDEAERSRSI